MGAAVILLALVSFGVAAFLSVRPLQRRFEARLAELERRRVEMVERGLSKEFLFIEPKRLRRDARRLLLAGTLLSVALLSPLPLLLALVSVWVLPQAFVRIVTSTRRKKLQQQLSHALPTISATLRAGHTFERAVETLARTESPPISQEFGLLLQEIRFGATLPAALENLITRTPLRDLEIVVRAVAISHRAGSNLAEAFDRVAETVRARAALRDRVATLTAQGRLQAWVAIAMPVLMILILRSIAPEYLEPMFQTGIGRLLLLIAAAALGVGGIWIHKISRMEFLQ